MTNLKQALAEIQALIEEFGEDSPCFIRLLSEKDIQRDKKEDYDFYIEELQTQS